MLTSIFTAHGEIAFPAFLPDGTRGVVSAVSAGDLLACQVPAVQMNVFHLMQNPGSSTVTALGGLHGLAGWRKPISTDSGGFQVYSLIRQNPKFGTLNDKGAIFRIEDRKYQLTPEKSIQLQLSYGADILFCLDDCTHVDGDDAMQRQSVARTIAWAKRCKVEFDRLCAEKKAPIAPKLFAVIQGGNDLTLRRDCAQALLEMGFDGFGYGGWPLDSQNRLLVELLGFVREQVPAEYPLHALGVGHPPNVAACVRLGYPMFDSTMPTRDARHGRLYAWQVDPDTSNLHGADWFGYVYPTDKKHIKDSRPICPHCDCPTCQQYALGYIHHLYKIGDPLYQRLTTLHNLRFMTRLMARLKECLAETR
jgi:queuine tRNA-ribosyltransferase